MKRRLIPYAGYDPKERPYEDLQRSDLRRRKTMLDNFGPRKTMNVDLAIKLRTLNWKWDAIGEMIALIENRKMPYRGVSVCNAIKRSQA